MTKPKRNAAAVAVFERHKKFAYSIAYSVSRNLPSEIDRADVQASALLGLWESALKHHALPDDQFLAYAGIRIRGACWDGLRASDWISRRDRQSVIETGSAFQVVGLERAVGFTDFYTKPNVEALIDAGRRMVAVKKAVRRLPKQQRLIVRRILAGERQVEIGRDLGYTDARISQIVSAALICLRSALAPKS